MSRSLVLFLLCTVMGTTAWGQNETSPIVVEEFTATWCSYCYACGMALDRIVENSTRDEVLVVAYHSGDSFQIPFTNDRMAYYGVSGFPTAWIGGAVGRVGGLNFTSGETGIATMYNTYVGDIQNRREARAGERPFRLHLEGSVGPELPEMKLTVSSDEGYPNPVSAVFLITEDHIVRPRGGVFSNRQPSLGSVARCHLGTEIVDLPSPGTIVLNVVFDDVIPHDAPENLRPVVFLQDDSTREILAAVGTFSEPDTGVHDWWLYE